MKNVFAVILLLSIFIFCITSCGQSGNTKNVSTDFQTAEEDSEARAEMKEQDAELVMEQE